MRMDVTESRRGWDCGTEGRMEWTLESKPKAQERIPAAVGAPEERLR